MFQLQHKQFGIHTNLIHIWFRINDSVRTNLDLGIYRNMVTAKFSQIILFKRFVKGGQIKS